MTGLEQRSLDIFDIVRGGIIVSGAEPRTGGFCITSPVNAGDVTINIEPLRSEIFVRIYVRLVSGAPVATEIWFRLLDGDGVTLLDITETGQVWLGEIGGGVDKGNAGPLTTDYQRWEVRYLVDNAAGLLDVRVDGVSMVSDSGIDTRTGAVDTIGYLDFGTIDIGGVDGRQKRFDDIAINNTLGPHNNSWCGAGAIIRGVATANGTTNDFSLYPDTGETNWEDVDEIPPNNDTDYVYATDIGQSELYTLTNLETIYGVARATQVKAVAWWFNNRLVYNGDGRLSALHKQTGFTTVMPSVKCPEIAFDYSDITILEVDAVTGFAFTAGDIDDSEWGFRNVAP